MKRALRVKRSPLWMPASVPVPHRGIPPISEYIPMADHFECVIYVWSPRFDGQGRVNLNALFRLRRIDWEG